MPVNPRWLRRILIESIFAAFFITLPFWFCGIREAQPSMVEMPLALGRKGPAAYNLDGEHRRI
jgi:hypothetical protein